MVGTRVLLANEPRAYREAIGGALGLLCPGAEVTIVGPDELDAEILRVQPDVVLCSLLTEAVRAHASTWVLLYPDGEARVVVCVHGDEETCVDLPFEALARIVDGLTRARGAA